MKFKLDELLILLGMVVCFSLAYTVIPHIYPYPVEILCVILLIIVCNVGTYWLFQNRKIVFLFSTLFMIIVAMFSPIYKVDVMITDKQSDAFANINHYALYRKNFPFQESYFTFDSINGNVKKEIEITSSEEPMIIDDFLNNELTEIKVVENTQVNFKIIDDKTFLKISFDQYHAYGWFDSSYSIEQIISYILVN